MHTIGGVVQPAEQLMVIVPDDTKLEIEATVLNKDVGFVHAGQPVEIKIEAFTFTRYGLLHGTVADLSRDTAPTDQRRDQQNRPALTAYRMRTTGNRTRLATSRISRSMKIQSIPKPARRPLALAWRSPQKLKPAVAA